MLVLPDSINEQCIVMEALFTESLDTQDHVSIRWAAFRVAKESTWGRNGASNVTESTSFVVEGEARARTLMGLLALQTSCSL